MSGQTKYITVQIRFDDVPSEVPTSLLPQIVYEALTHKNFEGDLQRYFHNIKPVNVVNKPPMPVFGNNPPCLNKSVATVWRPDSNKSGEFLAAFDESDLLSLQQAVTSYTKELVVTDLQDAIGQDSEEDILFLSNLLYRMYSIITQIRHLTSNPDSTQY